MQKVIKIFIQVILLYMIYLLGVWVQKLFQLTIPGSIIGMMMLFGLLHVKFFPNKWVKEGSSFLVKFLPLLFIPATVGIMDYFSLFTSKGIITIIIVLFSTAIVMISSSFLSERLSQKKECEDGLNERKYSV